MRLWIKGKQKQENINQDTGPNNWYDLIPIVPKPPNEKNQQQTTENDSSLIDQFLQQKNNEELDLNLELKIEIIERKRILNKTLETMDRLICHTNNLLHNRGIPVSQNAWMQRRTELEKSLLNLIQEKIKTFNQFRQDSFKIKQSFIKPKKSFISVSDSVTPFNTSK